MTRELTVMKYHQPVVCVITDEHCDKKNQPSCWVCPVYINRKTKNEKC